jgi:hypothetical protein
MGDGLGLNFWGKGKSIADGSLGGAKGIQIISQQQHSPKEYTVRGRMSGRFAFAVFGGSFMQVHSDAQFDHRLRA